MNNELQVETIKLYKIIIAYAWNWPIQLYPLQDLNALRFRRLILIGSDKSPSWILIGSSQNSKFVNKSKLKTTKCASVLNPLTYWDPWVDAIFFSFL
jgi:hypothetical protein